MKTENQITLHNAELDGKKIAFSSLTSFLVQVGKGRGSYRTRYGFSGASSLVQAVHYYKAINIGNGYKKRLFSPEMKKPTLARAFSC